MAEFIRIRVERLPEGVYLATSPDVPGLVVETGTCEEAQRIAPLVALDLMEASGKVFREQPQFSFTFD